MFGGWLLYGGWGDVRRCGLSAVWDYFQSAHRFHYRVGRCVWGVVVVGSVCAQLVVELAIVWWFALQAVVGRVMIYVVPAPSLRGQVAQSTCALCGGIQ
jgi:hypothetical protein